MVHSSSSPGASRCASSERPHHARARPPITTFVPRRTRVAGSPGPGSGARLGPSRILGHVPERAAELTRPLLDHAGSVRRVLVDVQVRGGLEVRKREGCIACDLLVGRCIELEREIERVTEHVPRVVGARA